MSRIAIAGIAVLVVLFVLIDSTLFTVDQTEQVLITQFGQPVRVIAQPGLHVKTPFVQTVITFDKRLLNIELPGEQVILGDQRRLVVDSFTVFRITDPLLYYQSVGPAEDGIRGRLNSVVSASLRRRAGRQQAARRAVGQARPDHGDDPRPGEREMKGFGVAIEDVRIRRADLPEENTKAILSRMQSERQRVAAQARAEGAEASAKIRADAERERTVLLAEARATADRLRGEGEAEAIRTFAKAYQQDAGFYLDLAHACRPIGMPSKPAIPAWCLPPTTISCAIFRSLPTPAGQ